MSHPWDRRFGVEVELVGLPPDDAARVLDDCLGRHPGRSDGWAVVADPSVPAGFELRSPPLHVWDLSLLELVFAQLRRAGGDPSPARAGVHVHVESLDFSAQQLANLAVMWSAAEPSLRRVLEVHPRRALRYCRPIVRFARRLEDVRTIGDLLENWSAAFEDNAGRPAKERSLNFESHEQRGTVEFRLFNSVATQAELRRCVAIALGFTDRARRPATSLRTLPTPDQDREVTERPPDGPGPVALMTDGGSFHASTFNALLEMLLDASFVEDKTSGWFEPRGKRGGALTHPARELDGQVDGPAPEAYARAAVERLADSGYGTVLTGDCSS